MSIDMSTSTLPLDHLKLTPEQAEYLQSAIPHLNSEQIDEIYQLLIPKTEQNIERYYPYELSVRQRAFTELKCTEAFYGGAAGGGKLLPLTTKLPTPTGWTTMGEVRPGDTLYGEHGQQIKVLHVYGIERNPVSYRLTFDDHTTVEACADHRWVTFNANELSSLQRRTDTYRARRRLTSASNIRGSKSAKFSMMVAERNKARAIVHKLPSSGSVRTTQEIYETLKVHGRCNHAIKVADPIQCEPKQFLLDPYLLGVWLGDGTAKAGSVTSADPSVGMVFTPRFKLSAVVEHKGYDGPCRKYRYLGLRQVLRKVGVFDNKHIPSVYLRGSIEQRRALLQGLMDTDGTCAKDGSVSFSNTNKQIIDGVIELLGSLGYKFTVRERRAKLYGKDCGTSWCITWITDEPVFLLQRKLQRQKPVVNRRTRFRYIVQCEPIQSVPMRCIKVDNPTGLFLITDRMIPTHNSDALIADALQYIHITGYRAIVFRRVRRLLQDLIDRTHEWLSSYAEWNEGKLRWTFPNGAYLGFGHMEHEQDKFNYKGPQYQYIGWDELTEFTETQYLYMFSRLRTPECAIHKGYTNEGVKLYDASCRICQSNRELSAVPLRVRGASNPDGIGRDWVKRRFVSPQAEQDVQRGNYQLLYMNERNGKQFAFVPSLARDNPGIDAERYIRESLSELDPITRSRLEHGDWTIQAQGLIKLHWLRYYTMTGDHIALLKRDGSLYQRFDQRDAYMFMTGDTAGTSEDIAIEKRGKPPSWSVIMAWLRHGKDLVLMDLWRKRVAFPDLLAAYREMHRKHPRAAIKVENRHFGPAIYQTLRSEMVIGLLEPGQRDKVERAAPLLNMLEQGQVYLPRDNNSWRPTLESEWLGWTGDKEETNDQIDCSAYAATVVGYGLTHGWGGADATRVPIKNQRLGQRLFGSQPVTNPNRFTPW